MKSKTVLAIALGALASSCVTNHWNPSNIGERLTYQFTGYRGAVDGTVFEFMAAELGTIGVTTARHFLLYNPDNPFNNAPVGRGEVPTPPPVEEFEIKNPTSPRRVF